MFFIRIRRKIKSTQTKSDLCSKLQIVTDVYFGDGIFIGKVDESGFKIYKKKRIRICEIRLRLFLRVTLKNGQTGFIRRSAETACPPPVLSFTG